MTAAERGRLGEEIACRYYKRKGWHIVCTNYRTRQGEVDVIAQKGETYVFAEVKARSEGSIAAPREFVTAAKQQRVMLAAQHYVMARLKREVTMRFDVIEVAFPAAGKPVVRCIENAFGM